MPLVGHDTRDSKSRHLGDRDRKVDRLLACPGPGTVLTGVNLDVNVQYAVIALERMRKRPGRLERVDCRRDLGASHEIEEPANLELADYWVGDQNISDAAVNEHL